ncbi:hypothetical protein BDQ17DRAFT_1094305 [Cyathus striatus]|nr:hypothetical protein BDQ17DRAFT_1094305 [Cyathus striatus]
MPVQRQSLAQFFYVAQISSFFKMLFKRSKHPFNNDPTTPKFKNVALPPTSPLAANASSGWRIARSASVLQDRQPSIPYAGQSRHRVDSNAGYATDAGYGVRERKPSMRYDDDDICKPAKPKYDRSPTSTTSGATPPIKGEAGLEKPAKPKGGWLKSAMKGGSYYMPATGKVKSPSRVEPAPEPVQVHTSRPVQPTPHPQSNFVPIPINHHPQAYPGQVPGHPQYQAHSGRPVLPHSQG